MTNYHSNDEVELMMQRDCGSCRYNKDGKCTYFGEAIEDAYLVDCPCKDEASTEELTDEQIYELQSSERDYCEMYEPTYNPEDRSM